MFSERLKKLRESKGWSQKDLGQVIGITAAGVGYYELNRNEPNIETLIKLARIFDVTTDYLLGIDKEKRTFTINKIVEPEDIPEEGRKELEEFKKYLSFKYSIKG